MEHLLKLTKATNAGAIILAVIVAFGKLFGCLVDSSFYSAVIFISVVPLPTQAVGIYSNFIS